MRAISALILFAATLPVTAQSASAPAQPTVGILHPADLKGVLPGTVFFRGQSATTQLRNSAGVRFEDGSLMMTALVDNSGYSSGIQQKYQAYLLTEVTLDFGGKKLPPGAYGAGIVRDGDNRKFVVMNLAAQDVFQTAAGEDEKLHRPVPLQIVEGSAPGQYRLYLGRNYIDFKRAQ
ncbi:MAG TPA: hypothetical protein VMA71_00545 [Alloacidobacterium sp.]|nr:hypothetical protein [Alloacidobacterium sp.]